MLIAKFAGLRTCFQLGDKLIDRLTLLFIFPKLVPFEYGVISRVDTVLRLFL